MNTNLPSFDSPPINEMLIGIQFDSIPAFRAIDTFSVWKLFKTEFPVVEDVPPLQPQLEIFGGGQPQFNISLAGMPLRPRSWFISEDQTHLIQFQDDRLLLNWRKKTSASATDIMYPRYESIADRFIDYLDRLRSFFKTSFITELNITQVELVYINVIPMPDLQKLGNYVNFIGPGTIRPEAVAANFVEKPYDATNMATRKFLDDARRLIVQRFCELTTQDAQRLWGRHE